MGIKGTFYFYRGIKGTFYFNRKVECPLFIHGEGRNEFAQRRQMGITGTFYFYRKVECPNTVRHGIWGWSFRFFLTICCAGAALMRIVWHGGTEAAPANRAGHRWPEVL